MAEPAQYTEVQIREALSHLVKRVSTGVILPLSILSSAIALTPGDQLAAKFAVVGAGVAGNLLSNTIQRILDGRSPADADVEELEQALGTLDINALLKERDFYRTVRQLIAFLEDQHRDTQDELALIRGALEALLQPTDLRARTDKQIFVSYSRADTDFARQLYFDLQALSFKLWRDRSEMKGGEDWRQEIMEAIDECGTMILCMSPASLASKYVAWEWQYARQHGKRVIPVVAASVEFEDVPRWMGRKNWLDFREEQPEHELQRTLLIDQLNTAYVPHKVPFMVEPLPKGYVERPAQFDEVLHKLVDEQHGAVALTAALQGKGGFGKTTLAQAICHDLRVRGAFDDGIIWITLGENPKNPLNVLLSLLEHLTGSPRNYQTVDVAKDALRSRLQDRYVLIVIDDVWQAQHLEPYLGLCNTGAYLISTRYPDELPEGSYNVDVDKMTRPEAIAVLSKDLPDDPVDWDGLAERLFDWPLLLGLAHAALAEDVLNFQVPLPKAFAEYNATLDAEGLGTFADEVEATLGASIRHLNADERARFAELCIFSDDVKLPLALLNRFWKQQGDLPHRLIQRLAKLGLVRDLDLKGETVGLHDVVRTYLRQRYATYLADWNAALLATYNRTSIPWHIVEHDGYLYFHLVYHLIEAGRQDELFMLLTARPEWMQTKYVVCVGDAAYVEDLTAAMAFFSNSAVDVNTAQRLVALYTARQVVYARTNMYTDKDLEILVWLSREDEAIAMARLRDEPKEQFDGLYTILVSLQQRDGSLNQNVLNLCNSIAQNIYSAWSRAEALCAIAAHLDRHGDPLSTAFFQQALDTAEIIASAWSRAYAFRDIAAHLAECGDPQVAAIFQLALDTAQSIRDTGKRAKALRDIVPYLARAGQFQLALDTAQSIKDAARRAKALRDIAVHLAADGQFQESLNIAYSIDDPWRCAMALRDIAVYLRQHEDSRANTIFQQALDIARTIDDIGALRDIAVHFVAVGQLQQALDTAHSIHDAGKRAKALLAIASQLAQQEDSNASIIFKQTLDTAQSIRNTESRAYALRDIAVHLAADGQFQLGLDTAQSIEHASEQATALRDITTQLAIAGRFQQALDTAQSIEHAKARAAALRDIAGHLAKQKDQQAASIFQQTLDTAQSIDHIGSRDTALRAIATQLAIAGQFQHALDIAYSIHDVNIRDIALRTIAAQLATAGQFQLALEIVQSIKWSRRADAISEIAVHLAAAGHFQKAWNAAHSIYDTWNQAHALRDIAAELAAGGQFQQALTIAHSIKDDRSRAEALCTIAAHLSQQNVPQATVIFQYALDTAYSIDTARRRAKTLCSIVSHLATVGQFEYALDTAYSIDAAGSQAKALCTIATQLAFVGQFQHALDIAQSIDAAGSRAEALCATATHLAEQDNHQARAIFQQALDDAQTIRDTWRRVEILGEIAAQLAIIGRFQKALAIAQSIRNAGRRADALANIATTLAQSNQFQKALQVAQAIDFPPRRVEALRDIAAALTMQGIPEAIVIFQEALVTAQSIDMTGERLYALRDIAAQLLQAGQWQWGLEALGPRELSDYIQWLANQRDIFEAIEPGLTLTVLCEAVRIVAWHNPNWRHIHDILSRPATSS